MKKVMYKLINISKLDIIKNILKKKYSYNLDFYTYNRLLYSNNNYINKLVCNEIKNKFINEKNLNNNLNLHRWCLKNKNKTINENEYPW